MVGGDVTEGISGDGADRFPVHCYAGNTMAGGGGVMANVLLPP